MINRYATPLLAAILMLCAATARPAASSSQEPVRIAYVDLDRVAENSKMVRQRIDSVEMELREKQEAYAEKMKELRSLRERLVKQESVMSEAQVEQAKARMQQLQDDLKYLEFEYGKALDNTSRNLIEPVLDEVLTAVRSVATRLKIDIVLRGDLVLFSSDRVDITAYVIQELDRSAAAGAEKTVKPE